MSKDHPGHWLSLVKSFDFTFYPAIARQSFGRSIVYIILLSFVVSLALSTKYALTLNSFIPRIQRWAAIQVSESWPPGLTEIRIENGRVSSTVNQPFRHNWGDFVFILDTTGKTPSLEGCSEGILISRDKITVKSKQSKYETKTQEFDLAKVDSFILRQGDAKKGVIADIVTKGKAFSLTRPLLKSLLKFFVAAAFLAMFLWFFFYFPMAKITQALIFSLFGLIINKRISASLNYAGVFNIALYALTPATFISGGLTLAGVKIPLPGLLYSLLYGLYLVFGIKSVKEQA